MEVSVLTQPVQPDLTGSKPVGTKQVIAPTGLFPLSQPVHTLAHMHMWGGVGAQAGRCTNVYGSDGTVGPLGRQR
jgi:hypothetical protein